MAEITLKPSAMRILTYMQEHGSITGREAMMECGATEYRKRIAEIRDAGIPVVGEYVTGANRYGDAVRYKRYRILEERS